MEIEKYLKLFKTRIIMITFLSLTATICTFLLTYLIPEKYEATSLVLVKPHENIKISSNKEDKELLNFPVGGGKVETPSNTYMEVIKSRAIAERVVRQLQLDKREPEVVRDTFFKKVLDAVKKQIKNSVVSTVQILKYGRVIGELPPSEKAVKDLQENISLSALKDTYLFEIKYTARNPKEAAAVANVAADLFLEYQAELNAPEVKGALAFLEERLRTSEKELSQARLAYRNFKVRNKTIAFKEETTDELKIMADMESDLEKLEVKLAGILREVTPSNPRARSVLAERDRLVSALSQRKAKINALPEKEKQLGTLQLSVQIAEDLYQLIRKQYEEVRLRIGREVSEIKVVSTAVAPMYPSGASRGYYVVAALLVSLLSGISLVLFFEYLDTSVKGLEDVEKGLGLRVLATVPPLVGCSQSPR